MNVIRWFGQIAYVISLPIVRRFMKGGNRSYVVIVYDKQILLVKNTFGRNRWDLPGGGAKSDETSIETVIRETEEEIGLTLPKERLKAIASGTWKTDALGFQYTIFICYINQLPKINKHSLEIDEVRWFDFANILSQNKVAEEVHAALLKISK